MHNRGSVKRKRENLAFRKNALTIDGSTTLEAIDSEHLESCGTTTAILDRYCQAEIVAQLPACITTIYIPEFARADILQSIPKTVSLVILNSHCGVGLISSLPRHLQIKTTSGDLITFTPAQEELEMNAAADLLGELSHSTELLKTLAVASEHSGDDARPAKKPRLEQPAPMAVPAAPAETSTIPGIETLSLPIQPLYSSYPTLFNPLLHSFLIPSPPLLPTPVYPPTLDSLAAWPLLASQFRLFPTQPAPSAPQIGFTFNLGTQ